MDSVKRRQNNDFQEPFSPLIHVALIGICWTALIHHPKYCPMHQNNQEKRRTNSYFTLKLICLASSLASWSAWLEALPEVNGKRTSFISEPHPSQ